MNFQFLKNNRFGNQSGISSIIKFKSFPSIIFYPLNYQSADTKNTVQYFLWQDSKMKKIHSLFPHWATNPIPLTAILNNSIYCSE